MSAKDQQVNGNHYKSYRIQPVHFISQNGLGFLEGCVIKRLCRYSDKDGLEDLKKARHEIDLLIEEKYGELGNTQKVQTEDNKSNQDYNEKPAHEEQRKNTPEEALQDFYRMAQKSLNTERPFIERLNYNKFLQFLADQFGNDAAERLAHHYLIGDCSYFGGSPIFWQVDQHQRFRFANVVGYHRNGERVKNEIHSFDKLGSSYKNRYSYPHCLFGAHLIPYSSGPFCIVENEKTAVIASMYLPGFTWLATAGQHNIKPELLEPLKDKTIILHPGFDANDQWQKAANQLKDRFNIACSTFLYDNATPEEIASKLEMENYLLRYPVPEPKPQPKPHPIPKKPNLNNRPKRKTKAPEKAVRKKANKFTSQGDVKAEVFNVHGKVCLACGATKDIQLDHIKPISKGGKNNLNNLQPLCGRCNRYKGTRTIDYT